MLADSGQLVAAPGMLAPALAEASRTAAMVVIPARGADAPIVPVMDTVAEALLQEAHGPVVVIPATTWNTFDRPVVLGLDLEEPGVPGIRFAAAVARRAGMPLKVVVADERCEDIDELRNRAVAILTEAAAELLPSSYDVMISPHEPADALLAERVPQVDVLARCDVGSHDADGPGRGGEHQDGVQPGAFTHLTEFFGPLLGVMRAENLETAIQLVNQTGYGLTSGLESLDTREQEVWQESVLAGNLYINRGTTGAIVLRQPFGGMGKSALGPGLKAGSIEYVTQFMDIRETAHPPVEPLTADHRLLQLVQEWQQLLRWGYWRETRETPEIANDIEQTISAVHSCLHQMETRYGRTQDYFHLRGQDNLLRYLPIKDLVIRLHPDDSLFSVLARCAAALIAGCSPRLSVPPGLNNGVTDFLAGRHGQRLLQGVEQMEESDGQLVARIATIGRLRYAAPDRVSAEIFAAAAQTGAYIARTPVYMEGRIELLQYLRQQAICNNYHRYGNLGERAMD